MTVQVSEQQPPGGRRRKRLLLTVLALVFLTGIATIWMFSAGGNLPTVFGIVFTLLGILIAFFQWQLPVSVEAQAGTAGVPTGESPPSSLHEQAQGMVLGVSKHKGALVIKTRKELRGSTINLSFGFDRSSPKADLASSVVAQRWKGSTAYVAVFPSLEPGNYTVYTDAREGLTKCSVFPGRVEEIDWR